MVALDYGPYSVIAKNACGIASSVAVVKVVTRPGTFSALTGDSTVTLNGRIEAHERHHGLMGEKFRSVRHLVPRDVRQSNTSCPSSGGK